MRTLLPALLLAPSLLLAETFAGAPVALDFGPEVSVGRKAILAGLATLYLPRIADALGAPFDYAAPITLHVTEAADAAPGVTLGRAITLSGHHLRRHPDDAGMFVHELTHVVQAYPSGATPAWLVEGITDYLRYYLLLPEPTRRADPAAADHRRGYADAALLLDHLVRTRHNGDARALLHPLNTVCRRGEDGAAWLARTYGDPDALMGEIRAAAKAAPAR